MNCGRSSSVEWKLPKLQRRVRFPSPAPLPAWPSAGRFCYATSLRERQFPRSIACTCEYAAYRPGCVGFWAVFRCYKAERWGCGPTPGTAHLRGGAMPEPICSKQSPPRPQHPIFGIFRRGGLQFGHSVRRTHRQTGGITTIDPRHAGDTPTETFYGSNSPHQARGVGGRLGHHVGIRAPTAEARGVDRKAEARPTPPPPPSPPPKINQKSHAIPTQTFQALKYIVGIATVWGRFDSSGDRIACDIAREPQHCTRHRSRGRRRDRRARPGAGGQWQSLAGLRTTRPAIDQPPCATVVEGAGGPGGPDYGAHGRRRGQAPRKVARNSIA